MSSQRKLNGYLERKDSLISEYQALKSEFTPEQQNRFYILIKLDEQLYEYHVCVSYLESQQMTHKPKLDTKDLKSWQTKMKIIPEKIRQLENEIFVDDLLTTAPRLNIIRKEIMDNAKEAGKIIHSYEVMNPKQVWHFLDDRMYELKTNLDRELKQENVNETTK